MQVYDSSSEVDPAPPRLDYDAVCALTSGQQASPRQQAVERLKALHLGRSNSPVASARLSAPVDPQPSRSEAVRRS